MTPETPAGVYTGPTTLRPTGFTKALIVPVLLIAITATSRTLSLAPLVAVVVVIVLDAAITSKRVDRRTITARLRRHAVFSPERFVLELDVTAGPRSTLVPYGFSLMDTVTAADVTALPANGGIVEVVYPDGHTTSRRFFRWALRATVLGFVQVLRADVAVLEQPAHRAPGRTGHGLVIEGVDETGRLREYVTGDRQSRISWPTTARTGSMHVRDTAVSESGDVCIVIDLGELSEFMERGFDFTAMETAMSLASSIACDVLDEGRSIRLVTAETSAKFWRDELDAVMGLGVNEQPEMNPQDYGSVLRDGVVADEVALAERLARADLGPVQPPPSPHILITLQGAQLRS